MAKPAELVEGGPALKDDLAFAGGFELSIAELDERHDLGPVGIVAGEVMKPRDAGGLFR